MTPDGAETEWSARRAGKSVLRGNPRLAAALAAAARSAGAGGWAGRLIRYSGNAAPIVTFTVTDDLGMPRSSRMGLRGGVDQVARDVWAYGWRGFEPPLPEVFAATARHTTGLVVDVGANTGFYSLLAASCAAGVRVHAFEPFPPVIEMLSENVALNDLQARIEVFPVALSDATGDAAMYVPRGAYEVVETSCSLSAEFKDRAETTINVAVTTLDEHVISRAGERIGLLKIDVEGLEHRVLAGASRVLGDHRPIICFELLPVGDAAAIEAIRIQHRYVVAALDRKLVSVGGPVRVRDSTWNQVLVPAEAVDAWIEDLPSHLRIDRGAV